MSNPTGKGGFVKGDPRCWRKGRPKVFDKARELAQAIAHEKATDKEGNTLVIDEHSVTVIEALIRNWAKSTEIQKQKAFVEYAYGKVPNPVEVTGKGGAPVQFVQIDIGGINVDEDI